MSLQVRRPEDLIIQLSDGDWIRIKKFLNAGESQDVLARMVRGVKAGETSESGQTRAQMDFDITQMGGLSKAVEYLIDWSAKGPDGKEIIIRDKSKSDVEAALKSITSEGFKEITDAIDAHEKAMEVEVQEKKRTPVGEATSSGT